jgi:hypothetical protein
MYLYEEIEENMDKWYGLEAPSLATMSMYK